MLQNPTTETISNYLTSGGATTLSGALNPDEPLSFDHWMSSLGVAIAVYGGYKMATVAKGTVRVQPKPSVASSADDVLAKPPGASAADDVVEEIGNGAGRAAKYSSQWEGASLNETINRHAPHAKPVSTPSGKIIYTN